MKEKEGEQMRRMKLSAKMKCKIAERLLKSIKNENRGKETEFDKYKIRLEKNKSYKQTTGLQNKDMWFMWNEVLNAARKAAGKPLRPWQENPFLREVEK